MPINILMPALSPTMTEGNLAKWHVKEGDSVTSGDIIAEIETDKATMEVEAVDEGTVGKLLVTEGAEAVPVNQVIAVLLEEGEDASAIEAAPAPAPPSPPATETPAAPQAPAAPTPAAAPSPAPTPAPAAGAVDGTRVFASPLARRMAAIGSSSAIESPGETPSVTSTKVRLLRPSFTETGSGPPSA